MFVTGGSGFIGGAITTRLASEHDVLGMSRSERADQLLIERGATPVRCDLASVTESQLAGVDVVVHCAAHVADWAPASEYERNNVDGTARMLAAAGAAGVGRFVHMSSDSVLFGGGDVVDVDEDTPYPDTAKYRYADSKRRAEIMVREAHGFDTVTVRPVLVWGPGDHTILPEIVEMIDRRAFLWVGGGRNLVSTTHIDNLVHGVVLAIERGVPGGVYFLTDGPPVDFRSFVTAYAATAGRSPRGPSLPGPVVKTLGMLAEGLWSVFRPGSKPPLSREAAATLASSIVVSSDRASRELGYAPVITRDDAMAALAAGQGPGR